MRLGRYGSPLALLAAVLAGACGRAPATPALSHLEGRTLFTCCNIRYEDEEITDANLAVGAILPAGTRVRLAKIGPDSVTFVDGNRSVTLAHRLGAENESMQQYLDKVFVPDDPRPRIDAYPPGVRRAVASGRVERGMTREQVLASLGYPPADQTSLGDRAWTYRYNRWNTYQVVFDDHDKVADVVGRPAPTAQVRDVEAPAKKKRRKRHPNPP